MESIVIIEYKPLILCILDLSPSVIDLENEHNKLTFFVHFDTLLLRIIDQLQKKTQIKRIRIKFSQLFL